MPIPITIPRLGWNMEEGTFAGWLKREGETIRAGEMIFCLESEKATEEIECLDSGILRIAPSAPKAGDIVAVGVVIGYLLQEGETLPQSEIPASSAANRAETGVAKAPSIATASEKEKVGPISTMSPKAISPRARRVARELGVDWTGLRGTGRTGRIRERDIRAAAPANPSVAGITPMRKTIAERMLASHRETAPVTLTTTADATNLVNLRNQFKATTQDVPTFSDFLAKLCAIALRQHPALNSRWNGREIVVSQSVHVGIAVDTEAGLLVPVIRDVASLSIKQIAAQTRDLAERARQRRLTAEQMQGGTFTITNLGAYGIDAFTPIINHPECAILGMGRIQKQPVVIADQIVVREQISLSLTFDHRIVDGAPAARFLQSLTQLIENPGPWLT